MTTDRRRWLALVVVCLAQLMIVLDTTIVNVALPSIQRDLHFTQGNLTWVINAFLVTFGSFLLLAGRLGDLHRPQARIPRGVTLFTVASLLCGAADSSSILVGARFLQGIGAALQASVILAIIVIEFPEPADRARAMSAYVFTAVAGGSLGLLAGGVLTQLLSWHWIFFVNLPIGIIAVLAGRALIPADKGLGIKQGVDWLGSLLVTLAIGIAVYAIVEATTHGWGSTQVTRPRRHRGHPAGSLHRAGGCASRTRSCRCGSCPTRGLVVSCLTRGFLVTGMYGTWFLGSLYLEHVLHYDAIRTGLAFMPWTLTVAVLSMGVTRRLVARLGALRVMVGGLLLVALGLYVMHGISLHTDYFPRLAIGFFLMGLGRRQRLHADAPDRDGGRAAQRRGPRLRDRERLAAGRGSARTGDPQHLRDQPHQLAAGKPSRAASLAAQRLPPGLRARRSAACWSASWSRSRCCAYAARPSRSWPRAAQKWPWRVLAEMLRASSGAGRRMRTSAGTLPSSQARSSWLRPVRGLSVADTITRSKCS